MRIFFSFAASLVLIATLSLGLSGCASIDQGNRMQGFELQMLGYERAIRWSEFQLAASFRKPSEMDPIDYTAYEEIRVTSYQVVQTTFEKEGKIANISVTIDYFRETRPTVRKMTDKQKWEWDEASERWFLLTGLPVFK